MQDEILKQTFVNNTLYSYLISLLIIIFGHLFIRLAKYFVMNRFSWFFKKETDSLEDFLRKLFSDRFFPLLNVLVFYIALVRLDFTNFVHYFIEIILLIITIYFIVLSVQEIIIYVLKNYWHIKGRDIESSKLLNFLILVIQVFAWIIAILFLLDNLGIEIKGLITGLGVGGVAIAFASQALLADIFSYFTIFLDQPFDIGDFIIVGEHRGIVEHIGLKTTRLRSLSGELLVFSNKDLTNSRISNYGDMRHRRLSFRVGVVYSTEIEKLRKIPNIIEKIIDNINKTEFDRAHFAEYGDFSLIYETVYYVLDNDYKAYMDIQEKINLKIKEKFDKEDIQFAYPTQRLYLSGKMEKIEITDDNKKEKGSVES
ncbi:MAG: mechanosensitive ion channel family protein [Bacillota bacterium]